MSGGDPELYDRIGAIREAIGGLTSTNAEVLRRLDALNTAITEDRAHANMARINLNDRIDEVDTRLSHVEAGIESLQPVAGKVQDLERKGWRIAGIIGGLGFVFGAAFVLMKERILAFIGIGP